MFSALRLVLFDDGNLLKSVALAPWITYPLLLGAAYGFLRLPWDILVQLTETLARRAQVHEDDLKR
jgi:hypothetical protein